MNRFYRQVMKTRKMPINSGTMMKIVTVHRELLKPVMVCLLVENFVKSLLVMDFDDCILIGGLIFLITVHCYIILILSWLFHQLVINHTLILNVLLRWLLWRCTWISCWNEHADVSSREALLSGFIKSWFYAATWIWRWSNWWVRSSR